MKIDPKTLPWRDTHEVMVGCVLPRPIALVSTIGKDGVFDVAPFSSFGNVAVKPTLIHFSLSSRRDGQKKRTLRNIEASGEFVINVVTEAIADAQNRASATVGDSVDKFKLAGLTPVKASLVKPPLVAESPVNLECRIFKVLEFGESPRLTTMVIGEVLMVHVKDELWVNGAVDMSRLKAVGRLGGPYYCRTTDMFAIKRPDEGYQR